MAQLAEKQRRKQEAQVSGTAEQMPAKPLLASVLMIITAPAVIQQCVEASDASTTCHGE